MDGGDLPQCCYLRVVKHRNIYKYFKEKGSVTHAQNNIIYQSLPATLIILSHVTKVITYVIY